MFARQLTQKLITRSFVRSYASKSIYVGNLPWSTTKPELTELFSSHSEVYGVSIPIDGLGRSKGFAFVEVNEDGAVEAINALNNTDFKGRTIRISEATSPKPKYVPRADSNANNEHKEE